MSKTSWYVFGVVVGAIIGLGVGAWLGHIKTENCAPYNGGDQKQCVELIDQDPDPNKTVDQPELVVYPPETTTSIINGR